MPGIPNNEGAMDEAEQGACISPNEPKVSCARSVTFFFACNFLFL